ncbi:Phytochrome-like protein cph2 [Tsuneonella dongtanensis]|uniref:Phytochrome-like protein cph2 n=1 Tax=Tsuneonella dongtanensis TaxID=692370 RepID=A0A1B2AEF2_9SPHN|nr:EAL domain-containing protein [Tsuneonella dongtanensis]ANY20529.1 Phytochrome-like protein cph2 [Tsuneonella dongtanensis]
MPDMTAPMDSVAVPQPRWPWSRASDGKRLSGDRPGLSRRKIAAWAILIGLIAGFFDLPLPIEDTARAIRSAVRMHAADQSVVVVTVDDRSLNELSVNDPLRSDDARFLDRLFELGARRVFFDRAYADLTVESEDRQFRDALDRHKPHVYLGAMADFRQVDGRTVSIVPHPYFRPHASVVSLYGLEGPLGLSTKFPGQSRVHGAIYPSLSVALAGVQPFAGKYRVDFSIDHATVPIVSYIDVLKGRAGRSDFAGRDVVVAPSSRVTQDYHPVPYRAPAPGAVLHVLGAETLRNGIPRDLSWYPAFVLAALVVMWQVSRVRPSRRIMLSTVAILAAGPLALDARNVNVDVVPALMIIGIAWFRLHRLAEATYRGTTGLIRIDTLHAGGTAPEMDVIALKIRNFGTISANLTPEDIDELLIKARAMLRATERNDQFAFDKDTFVWLRPRAPISELENHVLGLHALFRTSITIGSQKPDVASSIGIDTIHDGSLRERTENAIQCAEDAAHLNKIYLISEPVLAADRAWRLQILSELEEALATDHVEVVFQPKVSLVNEAIVGAEALMRWTHPERGPIDPSMVIASAEEHNRVEMITRFVLERAMRDARQAVAIDPAFKVAVNISALDLRDPRFVIGLESIIQANRFPVANLVLEITETAPIENDATVTANLAKLKKLGVRLSVDDFGIGHASLHYLRQIPADEVKIDRSFVTGIETSTEDRALVRTAIDMIHSLGRTAVAEGVENKATVDMLRVMGCDVAQGYFYYRPITMETLVSRLQDGAMAA